MIYPGEEVIWIRHYYLQEKKLIHNSYTTKFWILKYIIQRFLVYSQTSLLPISRTFLFPISGTP